MQDFYSCMSGYNIGMAIVVEPKYAQRMYQEMRDKEKKIIDCGIFVEKTIYLVE